MDWIQFSQLGVGMGALAVLYFITKRFLEQSSKKDKWIQFIIEKFDTTVRNHIAHSSKIIKESNSIAKLTNERIKENTEVLKDLRRVIDKLNR